MLVIFPNNIQNFFQLERFHCEVTLWSKKTYILFYKQLGSGLSPQSCLYFQGFWSSELLNDCLVVWPSILSLPGIQLFLKSIFLISDFLNFPNNALKQLNFGVLSVIVSYFTFVTKEYSTFLYSVVFIVAYWKRVEPWKLLSNLPSAYKLVAC